MLTLFYIQDEFEEIDDHRAGKIVIQLNGRINKCGVISPRFNVQLSQIENWINLLLPARSFGYIILTTSAGIMDHEEARRKHVAGKVGCLPHPERAKQAREGKAEQARRGGIDQRKSFMPRLCDKQQGVDGLRRQGQIASSERKPQSHPTTSLARSLARSSIVKVQRPHTDCLCLFSTDSWIRLLDALPRLLFSHPVLSFFSLPKHQNGTVMFIPLAVDITLCIS
jgi:hypothetical protein